MIGDGATILCSMLAGAALLGVGLWVWVGMPTRVKPDYVWWTPAGIRDLARLTITQIKRVTNAAAPAEPDPEETVRLATGPTPGTPADSGDR